MFSARTERLLAWGLVGSLFVYVVLRAIFVPITYDEASTFFRYINLGYYWPGDGLWDANNHILNSFLSFWSYRVFGVDEIWLRLPNVLAGALYLAIAVLISQQVKSTWLKWTLLLALCCNHFVLEFFGLTRGYGLSMAFMLTALFYIFKWTDSGKTLPLTIGLIAMQAATLANLSVLVANVILIVGVLVWLIWKYRNKLLASLLPIVGSTLCVKWFVGLSFEYKERGLLYYGSGKGFWESTIGSIAEFGFPAVEAVFPVVALISLVVFAAATGYYLIKNGITNKLLFSYLFWGCGLALVVLHQGLEVNYPEDRVAMHFLILFPLGLVFLLDEIELKAIRLVAPTVLFIIPVNMALSANLTHVRLWKEDACARAFYFEMLRETEETGRMPTIAGYRLRDLPLYYYGFKNQQPTTVIQDIAYKGDEPDYQYAVLKDESVWVAYRKLAYNDAAGLYLMKRKQRKHETLWAEKTTPKQELNSDPYTVFYETDIDTMGGKDLLWEIELEMPSINTPFQAWVTTDIGTPEGKSMMQETVVLDWLKPKWQEGEVLKQKILIPNIPAEATHIKLFFWNIEQKPIALGEARVKLIQLTDN